MGKYQGAQTLWTRSFVPQRKTESKLQTVYNPGPEVDLVLVLAGKMGTQGTTVSRGFLFGGNIMKKIIKYSILCIARILHGTRHSWNYVSKTTQRS